MKKYPRELLDRPPSARRSYFEEFTVLHPLLKEAYGALQRTICNAMPSTIIMVYGPTGVGKTTLLEGLNKHLTEKVLAELENDPDRFPVVYMRTVAPEKDRFEWKDFFRRLLIELEEPAVDRKVNMQKWEHHEFNRH